ncbi:MAG: hydrogenase nickel incorporation protein HypB [Candidatus Jordarchaeum sp.]|uniref:hydrogenase nickel incorporation protein HypB n=1 Tax=Candidatus Jordarchaeum sp. TaxID=2823881 RepID=UPI00404B40E2
MSEQGFRIFEVEKDLIKANEELAKKIQKIFHEKNIKTFDVVGAIGAGKTAILETLVERLKQKYRLGLVTADVTTQIDADRIRRHGVKCTQINTGRECALTASLLQDVLNQIPLDEIDVLFVENVGNLICPADFIVGSDKRIVVVSITEGEHVVIKHPMLFKMSDIAVINKIDLQNVMDVYPQKMVKDALEINPSLKVVLTSAKTGEGIDELIKTLEL